MFLTNQVEIKFKSEMHKLFNTESQKSTLFEAKINIALYQILCV